MRLTRALAAVAALTLSAACVYDQPDFLKLSIIVNNNGRPVSNLRVDGYDWSVRFYDGSEIMIRLTLDNPFTGVDGHVAATSYDLNLSSGDTHYNCYYSCVSWDVDGYCYRYAEDCYAQNYSMDVTDISRARAAIAWSKNTTTGYTWNQNEVGQAEGNCAPNTWCQNDVFDIGLGFGAAGPHAAASSQTPELIPFAAQATLTDAEKAEVAKARTHMNGF